MSQTFCPRGQISSRENFRKCVFARGISEGSSRNLRAGQPPSPRLDRGCTGPFLLKERRTDTHTCQRAPHQHTRTVLALVLGLGAALSAESRSYYPGSLSLNFFTPLIHWQKQARWLPSRKKRRLPPRSRRLPLRTLSSTSPPATVSELLATVRGRSRSARRAIASRGR